jgi:chromosome condensin MukBEF complex kleisin-like MukF subunit
MRGFKDKDKPSITTQRRTVHEAYGMYLDGYKEFVLHDIMARTDVDIHRTSAIVSKCIKYGLVVKTGKKHEGKTIYKLTKTGIGRGEYYMKYYNPVTDELRSEVEQ